MTGRNTAEVFNEIYDKTNKKVLSYITAKCGRISDISDIFQETYMEVYSALVKHDSDYVKNQEAFVMKIAKQKLYRYYTVVERLKSNFPLFMMNEEGEEVSICNTEQDSISIDQAVDENLLILQVNEFLLKKPAAVQKIFTLYYYMDKSIPDISKLNPYNFSVERAASTYGYYGCYG